MAEESLPLPLDECEDVIFAEEDDAQQPSRDCPVLAPWKILIADDDSEIHRVTRFALSDFQFAGRPLTLLSAYSGREAQEFVAQHADIALILLDVVMESEDAGLQAVRHIRETLGNIWVRIVLRTGQPGQAPEKVVITDYDIDDYKTKSELTSQKLFTTLVTALRSFDTLCKLEASRQEARSLADAANRFVPYQFLQILNRQSIADVQPGDSIEQTMSVMFADIRNFTLLSEQMQPAENFAFINSFFSYLEPVITDYNGFIDKYIGDAIMALFRGGAGDAVQAGIAMSQRLGDYNRLRAQQGEAPVAMGIGINTGKVILGMVGGRHRLDGTAISDAVNLAARIERLTKEYGSMLLISEHTFAALDEPMRYDIRLIDRVQVSGRLEQISIFEVFSADRSESLAAKRAHKLIFEQAVLLYHSGDYVAAQQHFEHCRAENPGDRVVQLYCDRCRQQLEPPA